MPFGWLKALWNPPGDSGADERIRHLTRREDLDEALDAPLVVVYKHSPICAVSAWTVREIRRFAREHPDTPVYQIDVIRQRSISDWVARRLGVRHESPQALVVRDGGETWAASHGGITADALRNRVRGG